MKSHRLTVGCIVVLWLGLPGSGPAAGFYVEVGDILAANYNGDSVLKINPHSGAQESLGSFARPTDLALAPDGNLYVSELAGSLKCLILTNGVVTRINPATSLTAARGLALGPSGDLFVTGSGDRVMRVNRVTGAETLVTEGGQLTSPVGIDFLDSNHLAVASLLNSAIVIVDVTDGRQTVAPGGEGIDYPWGVATRDGDIYFTRYDQKLVQKLSGGTLSGVRITAGFPYGLGLEPDGTIVVGSSGPDVIERVSPQGLLLRTFSGGAIRQVTGIEIAAFEVGRAGTNRAPWLEPIGDQIVEEGASLTFTVTTYDPDQPAQVLSFSLDPGAPATASITSAGLFSYQPTEADGPGTNRVTVRVTDNGTPPLSGTNSFLVVAKEVNVAPELAPIEDQTVLLGNLLTFTLTATDTDQPTQLLTFSLCGDPPPGASVSAEGLFAWIPDQTPGTNLICVRVQDGGAPSLSSTQAISVVVRPWGIEVGDILAVSFSGHLAMKINPRTGVQGWLGTFDSPTDLALASNGWLYVSELGGLIKQLNLTNGTTTVVNSNKTVSDVWGVAVGPDGNLYVTSTADESVVKIDPLTGHETVLSQGNLLAKPYGIAVLDSEHLVVASAENNRLVRVALADGAQNVIVEESGVDLPWGVAVSGSDIYVASQAPQLIQRVSGGLVHSVYLLEQGPPTGIAMTPEGDIVSSANGFGTHQLLCVSPQGALLHTYSGGLIGDVTGIEVSPLQLDPEPPRLYLQSSQRVTGPFVNDLSASFDPSQPRVSATRSGTSGFYRLRSYWPVRISRIEVVGNQVVLTYDFLTAPAHLPTEPRMPEARD